MSRSSVRAAVVNYLQNAGLPGVGSGNVKPFPAKITPEGDFYQNEDPGHMQGVIIFTHIERQHEKRIELRGATGGGKEVTYEFAFTIFFRSSQPKSEDAGKDNETFLDAFISAVRASKTAGTSDGTVWQWGEGQMNGGTDVQIESDYPRSLNGKSAVTQVVSVARVIVIEQTVN